MNVSPIHIRVNPTERRLFEVAARQAGLNISQLVKKAVLAFVSRPLPRDEMAEALDRLEKFTATPAQLARHKVVAKAVDSGKAKGLNKKESLALLARLQSKKK